LFYSFRTNSDMARIGQPGLVAALAKPPAETAAANGTPWVRRHQVGLDA
jgi:hypothetical protein